MAQTKHIPRDSLPLHPYPSENYPYCAQKRFTSNRQTIPFLKRSDVPSSSLRFLSFPSQLSSACPSLIPPSRQMNKKEPLRLPLISEAMMNSYLCGVLKKCITSETSKIQDSSSTIIMFLDIVHRPEIGTSSMDWAQLSRPSPEDGDRIKYPKHPVLNKNTGLWIMSKNTVIVLIYHRHKS
jgi:hypothetical protein